jgi:SNF2 family DNA or RNA helicase
MNRKEEIKSLLKKLDKNILLACTEPFHEIFQLRKIIENLSYQLGQTFDINKSKYLYDQIQDFKEIINKRRSEIRYKIFNGSIKNKDLINCINRSTLVLKPHQLKVIDYMNKPENKTLLVVHSTGSGKTLTAITASQCYLDNTIDSRVYVVSPASLIKNFEVQMKYYGNIKNKDRYEFYTFDVFSRLREDTNNFGNSMIIIDEAHILKSESSTKFKKIVNFVIKAQKVLLLTATPFVNMLTDFNPLIIMLYQDIDVFHTNNSYIRRNQKNNDEQNQVYLNRLEYYLKDRVSYYQAPQYGYPEKRMYKINVYMSKEFYAKYIYVLHILNYFGNNPHTFYHGYRRAVNLIGIDDIYNLKVNSILDIINSGGKTLLFSNWLAQGLEIIIRILKEKKINFDIITGSVQANKRQLVVSKYNEGIIQVLLISMAGVEGLDLKNTKNIIIMDPVWNPAKLEQIIGRGVRYLSHNSLPPEQQYVNIYLLILLPPIENEKGREEEEELNNFTILNYEGDDNINSVGLSGAINTTDELNFIKSGEENDEEESTYSKEDKEKDDEIRNELDNIDLDSEQKIKKMLGPYDYKLFLDNSIPSGDQVVLRKIILKDKLNEKVKNLLYKVSI